MAVVFPGKFVYLAHLFTGSHETSKLLAAVEGAIVPVRKDKGIGRLATLEEVKSLVGDQLTGREIVITTVQNPYDYLVSMYIANKTHFQMRHRGRVLGRDAEFKDFLEIWAEMNQRPYMIDGKLFYHATNARAHIMRYETLKPDLESVLRKLLGTDGVKVPSNFVVPQDRDHWSTFYDDECYAFVNEHWRDEIVNFGYPFVWSVDQLT